MVHEMTPEELLGPLNEVEARRAPQRLYVAGDLSLFRNRVLVSVVGSRKATPEGLSRAKRISRMLAERGVVVVSGLADGIDTAAHRAAIEAGGRTVAVIGTPLDQVYPKTNANLQGELMEKHAVISQFAPGTPVQRRNFPQRNLTMALLVSASVIVEAGDTSGALNQGWEALRLGRLLFIMESVVQNASLTWPKEMLDYGAQVLSDRNLSEFLDTVAVGEVPGDALAV